MKKRAAQGTCVCKLDSVRVIFLTDTNYDENV